MNADLYAAWLTAGNHLQHVSPWFWAAIGASPAAWLTGRHINRRRHIRHGLARLNQYACHAPSRPILDDFHQPRKEAS